MSPLPVARSNPQLLLPIPPPPLKNGIPRPIISPALVAARKAVGFSAISPPSTPSMSSVRDWNNPSRFSLNLSGRNGGSRKSKRVIVDDSRWKFKREVDLPRPRVSRRAKKAYRSGEKGSSIPLDLKTLD